MRKHNKTAKHSEVPAGLLQPSGPLLNLAAATIVAGRWENRLPGSYDGPEFAELKKAIALTGGNTQPVNVRVLGNASLPQAASRRFEVVTGHRRLRACDELGLPVRAMVLPELDEQQLFLFVYHENSSREPLRPFEFGRMCAQALAAGMYPSLRNMCDSVGMDISSASRAVRLYELPEALNELIRSPLQWQLKDTDKLAKHIDAQNFSAKVEELRRIHGVMDRVPLLRALAGVGSTNEEQILEIIDRGEVAGRIYLSGQGKARAVFDRPLSPNRTEDLRRVLQAWLGELRET